MTINLSRRSLLRGASAIPLGAALSPAIIGKARAAAIKMRISSSQQNDPKFANGRVYFDNLAKHVKAGNLSEAVELSFFPDNQLGQEIDVINSVKLGVIDMPMDEALTRVAIDISGRPFLVFKAEFSRDKVGAFDTELVQEWFQAFAMNAGVTLHVETLYGSNDHHISESCFKGLARALRTAVAIDPRAAGEIPSTKGTLGG